MADNLITIIDNLHPPRDKLLMYAIEKYEFTKDMKLKIFYTDISGVKKTVNYSFNYDGSRDLDGGYSSNPEAYCLGSLIGDKIEERCW